MNQNYFSVSIFYDLNRKNKLLSESLFPFIQRQRKIINCFHYYENSTMGDHIELIFRLSDQNNILEFGLALDEILSQYLNQFPSEGKINKDQDSDELFFKNFPVNSLQYNYFNFDFDKPDNYYNASISYLMVDLFEEFQSDIWDNSLQILLESYFILSKLFGQSLIELLALFQILTQRQRQKIKKSHLSSIFENSLIIFNDNKEYFSSIKRLILQDESLEDLEIWQKNLIQIASHAIKNNEMDLNKNQAKVLLFNGISSKFNWETLTMVGYLIKISISED